MAVIDPSLITLIGGPLLQTLLGLPAEVRRQLAQQLLQDTEATAADTLRIAREAADREAAWTIVSSAPPRLAPAPAVAAPPPAPAAPAPAPAPAPAAPAPAPALAPAPEASHQHIC